MRRRREERKRGRRIGFCELMKSFIFRELGLGFLINFGLNLGDEKLKKIQHKCEGCRGYGEERRGKFLGEKIRVKDN